MTGIQSGQQQQLTQAQGEGGWFHEHDRLSAWWRSVAQHAQQAQQHLRLKCPGIPAAPAEVWGCLTWTWQRASLGLSPPAVAAADALGVRGVQDLCCPSCSLAGTAWQAVELLRLPAAWQLWLLSPWQLLQLWPVREQNLSKQALNAQQLTEPTTAVKLQLRQTYKGK